MILLIFGPFFGQSIGKILSVLIDILYFDDIFDFLFLVHYWEKLEDLIDKVGK